MPEFEYRSVVSVSVFSSHIHNLDCQEQTSVPPTFTLHMKASVKNTMARTIYRPNNT
jgi:hypothetical protein